MTDDVVVGLIGCGRIARYAHLPALMKADGIELRSICDTDRSVAEASGRRFEIERVYGDVEDILSDQEVEAVLIAVPDRFHIPIAGAAIAAGKHVLVEKPLGVTSEECRAFARLAATSGLKVQVGAMKRHDPGLEYARDFIREVVGTVDSFRCWYGVSSYRPEFEATLFPVLAEGREPSPGEAEYRADKERYYLTTHGAHVFDTIRFLAGEPAGVTARLATSQEGRFSWHGLIDLARGGLGHFELTIPVHRGWDEGFELFGQGGSVSIRTPFGFYLQPSEVRAFDASRGEWHVPLLGDSDPWERQLEAFAEAIRTDGPTNPDAEDGLAAVELIEVVRGGSEIGGACAVATVKGLQPLEVGIFAKTFRRPTLGEVLDAAKASGFRALHFNFVCAGLSPLPDGLDEATCHAIREGFARRDLVMVGVSATYNAIHPDAEHRAIGTARARRIIELCPALGTELATLCTGTRDPDDMWRAHPANEDPAAWRDLLSTLEPLLEAAEAASVWLGIEPEAANVVSSAARARSLLDEVGSERLRIVLDPANLVTAETIDRQGEILAQALDLLAPSLIQAHAKDVAEDGHVAAGLGSLDYDLYLRLLTRHGVEVPMIMHELAEDDVERARAFVIRHRDALDLDAPRRTT